MLCQAEDLSVMMGVQNLGGLPGQSWADSKQMLLQCHICSYDMMPAVKDENYMLNLERPVKTFCLIKMTKSSQHLQTVKDVMYSCLSYMIIIQHTVQTESTMTLQTAWCHVWPTNTLHYGCQPEWCSYPSSWENKFVIPVLQREHELVLIQLYTVYYGSQLSDWYYIEYVWGIVHNCLLYK